MRGTLYNHFVDGNKMARPTPTHVGNTVGRAAVAAIGGVEG